MEEGSGVEKNVELNEYNKRSEKSQFPLGRYDPKALRSDVISHIT